MFCKISTMIRTKVAPINRPRMAPNNLFFRPLTFRALIRVSKELKALNILSYTGAIIEGFSVSTLILRSFDKANNPIIKIAKTRTKDTNILSDSLAIIDSIAVRSEITSIKLKLTIVTIIKIAELANGLLRSLGFWLFAEALAILYKPFLMNQALRNRPPNERA